MPSRSLYRPGVHHIKFARGSQRPLDPFTLNQDSPQAHRLTAWWPFLPWEPDTLRDFAHGRLHNGTRQAGAAGRLIDVKIGTGHDFASARFHAGTTTGDTTGEITIAAWFHTDTVATGTNTIIAKRSGTTTTVNYALRKGDTSFSGNDELEFYCYNAGWFIWGTSGAALTVGTLFHVVCTYDGVNNPDVYLNGVLLGGAAGLGSPRAMLTNTAQGSIGALNGGTEPWNGGIYELRLYDRKFTQAEARQLYNSNTLWDLYAPLRNRVFVQAPAAGGLTISPGGIGSAEGFGTAALHQQVRPSGVPSAEAHGSPTLRLQIVPTGLSSQEAFGSAGLILTIAPSGLSSAEALGSPQLNQDITPTGLASAEAIGAHTVSLGGLLISPSAITSLEAFGTAALHQQIRPIGLAGAEAFGSARMVLALLPGGIASAEGFGTPVMSPGGVVILPGGIGSAEAVGALTLAQQIRPSGVAGAEAFGAGRLAQQIRPSGVTSAEVVGLASLLPGPVTIVVTGIPSAEAFGAVVVLDASTLIPRLTFPATSRVFVIDGTGRVYEIQATTRKYTFNA